MGYNGKRLFIMTLQIPVEINPAKIPTPIMRFTNLLFKLNCSVIIEAVIKVGIPASKNTYARRIAFYAQQEGGT